MVQVKRILIEVSPGELIDKLTILEIKSKRIQDTEKLGNIRKELDVLRQARGKFIPDSAALEALAAELKTINESLWDIEETIRDCERKKRFRPEIHRTRSVRLPYQRPPLRR